MAGIPVVMQAMLGSLEGRLESGPVVQSRTVIARLGESQIAARLTTIQSSFPDVDLGSYPFFRDQTYGTALVMRGTDPVQLDAVQNEVRAAIVAAGGVPEETGGTES
jgi:molybdopterin-biosynthesis enzyme MoeA-like protein